MNNSTTMDWCPYPPLPSSLSVDDTGSLTEGEERAVSNCARGHEREARIGEDWLKSTRSAQIAERYTLG